MKSSYAFLLAGLDSRGAVAIYFLSTNESFFVRTDGPGNELLSGEIMRQLDSGFSAASFAQSTVLHLEGVSSNGSTTAGIGVPSVVDSSFVSGTYDANDAGRVTSQAIASKGYALTSTEFGRGTLKFASNDFTFYLFDSATAFAMGSTETAVKTGMLEGQTASDSLLSGPAGSFAAGSEGNTRAKVAFESGRLTVAPAAHLARTADLNLAGNVLSAGQTHKSKFLAAAQGRLRTAEGAIYYVVLSTRMIEADMQSGQAAPTLVTPNQ